MFEEKHNLWEIIHKLDPKYVDQAMRAGPLIGVLWIDAFFQKFESPPAPSPVGANLCGFKFHYWSDVRKHLRDLKREGIQYMGRRAYSNWSRKIEKLCNDPSRLLALSIPLFVESQMNVVSSKDALFTILKPIVDSRTSPLYLPDIQDAISQPPNAAIVLTLHAGQTPFALVCHTSDTLRLWFSYLEAATILLSTTLVIEAEQILDKQNQEFMYRSLETEFTIWQNQPPRIGQMIEWDWLPRLM